RDRPLDDRVALGEQGAGDLVVAGGGVEEGSDRERFDEAAIVDGGAGLEGAPGAGAAVPLEDQAPLDVEAKHPPHAAFGEAAGLAGGAASRLGARHFKGELLELA